MLELVKHRRTSKVEYLLHFLHDVWQDDVENCPKFVKRYWDSKPAFKRLFVAVCVGI